MTIHTLSFVLASDLFQGFHDLWSELAGSDPSGELKLELGKWH
jgi:hypothetical protein